jgi:transcriptional regulator with GAF, ATPase, and Fis domain
MAEPAPLLTETDVRELEKSNYRRALSIANGKVHGPGGAAELLGIKPTTLLSRLKIHGIEARKPDSR